MLTGLIPIDQGSAIIEGHNLMTEMDMVRQNLGVCPQHDILYNEMTVEEHLTLFASFSCRYKKCCE
jgi:ABC-type multidrug transport system ATPase subunit